MKRARGPRPPVRTPSGFAGFRFPPQVILVAVHWYLRYGLSYRDLEELRRIKAHSLMSYMAEDDLRRRESADELTRLNREMGLL